MKAIYVIGASLTVLATATIAPAQAQDAQGQSSGQGYVAPEDIIVTARRIQERLQDVPIAVTALQGDKLQSLGVTQVSDIRESVAGLNITSSAGRVTTPIYAMRGQRASDTVITQDAPVAVYVDEAIVTPLSGSNLGIFDLENVQVLKGPQGTLFGRNTTGGAILFTTAKPTDRLEGSIRLGYGRYDTRSGTAVLNLPVSEQIRFRAAADFTRSDGYGRVIGGNPTEVLPDGKTFRGVGNRLFSRDEINLRFTATIDPTDWLKTTTQVYYSRAHNGGTASIILDTPNPLVAAGAIFGQALQDAIARQKSRGVYDAEVSEPTGTRVKNYGIIHTDTIELSDTLTLKNIFAYRHTYTWDAIDVDGTNLEILDASSLTKTRSYSNETQLQGSAFDDRLTYVFGVYYFNQKGMDGNGGGSVPVVTVFGGKSTQLGYLTNSSFSGFGQASFKLTDTLNLTGGLRYSVDRRKADIVSGDYPLTTCFFTDDAGVPLPVADCVIKNSRSFAEPSWLISVDKKLSDDVLLYLSSRHSYRSGGFNLRANSNGLAQSSYAPEKVTDIELGLKSSQNLGDMRVTTNFALYYQWYKDIQRNVSTVKNGVIGNITQNAAKAHVYGGEAELNLRYQDLIDLGFNYAYVKPRYDSYPTFAPVFGVPNQPDDYSDRTFPFIPRHQINANLTISPDIGGVGKLNLIANAYYQSKILFSEDQQNRAQLIRRISPAQAAALPDDTVFGQKSYVLVNFRGELNDISGTGLSIATWMRNAFNKRYVDLGLVFGDSVGINSGTYGAPRSYGIDITYRF